MANFPHSTQVQALPVAIQASRSPSAVQPGGNRNRMPSLEQPGGGDLFARSLEASSPRPLGTHGQCSPRHMMPFRLSVSMTSHAFYSKSRDYLLKNRDPDGVSACRSAGFPTWTVLIGRTGFHTIFSIADPTLNSTQDSRLQMRLMTTRSMSMSINGGEHSQSVRTIHGVHRQFRETRHPHSLRPVGPDIYCSPFHKTP